MHPVRRGILILLVLFDVAVSAQIKVEGHVVDAETLSPLPFVNIGVWRKNVGTLSLPDGSFSLVIPEQYKSDTLTFSMVGYSAMRIGIADWLHGNQKIVQLKPTKIELAPVEISVSKLVESKFGIKGDGLLEIGDGSMNQNDIFEIAQLIRLDTCRSKITSLSLYIVDSKSDSATFRINFYQFDGKEPGELCFQKNIVQVKEIQKGWLVFDLSEYQIYLSGAVIVAIEFIPTPGSSEPIYYGIKLGGTSKSFFRSASQGSWNVPPHHYRMFLTALVDEKKKKSNRDELEESETKPTSILYSEYVKDSFSIYVSVPMNYESKREKNFPVVYLLDANLYFDAVASFLQECKQDAVLVGIGYTDFVVMDSLRSRDYTFPLAPESDSFPVSGGANNFLSFITHELFPYVNETYRIDTTNQTVMGHSLGGYFVLYSLYRSVQSGTNYFHQYVAASPSLHYCNGYLIDQFQKVSVNIDFHPSLFMTIGEREDSEEGGTGTESLNQFNSLIRILNEDRFENVHCEAKIYPGFGHMQTAVQTFCEALQK